MKVKELLTDPSKWTTGHHALGASGLPVSPLSATAVCWCLEGAVIRCYLDKSTNIMYRIRHRLGINAIFNWNDDSERTFEEVRNLIEEMDL